MLQLMQTIWGWNLHSPACLVDETWVPLRRLLSCCPIRPGHGAPWVLTETPWKPEAMPSFPGSWCASSLTSEFSESTPAKSRAAFRSSWRLSPGKKFSCWGTVSFSLDLSWTPDFPSGWGTKNSACIVPSSIGLKAINHWGSSGCVLSGAVQDAYCLELGTVQMVGL